MDVTEGWNVNFGSIPHRSFFLQRSQFHFWGETLLGFSSSTSLRGHGILLAGRLGQQHGSKDFCARHAGEKRVVEKVFGRDPAHGIPWRCS